MDKIIIGGYFNNGGRFVDSVKKSIVLCRLGQWRDIIRYVCNFFVVNGGVVILKWCCMIVFMGVRLYEESIYCYNGKKNYNNGDVFI